MRVFTLFWILFLILPLTEPKAQAQKLSAQDIAWAVYNRPVGKDSESYTQMILIDRRGHKKERKMYVAVKDDPKARKTFMRFLSPLDIRNTSFLSISYNNGKEEQFLYLPALRRVRRIAGSFRFHRFVNSDFTYEDLERRCPKKYNYQLMKEENYKASPCYVLKCWPKKRKYSAYQYWVEWVTKKGFLVVKVDYYDRRGHLCKRFEALEWKPIQGYWTIISSKMTDLKRKHYTLLIVDKIRYNVGLKNKIFTRRNLRP